MFCPFRAAGEVATAKPDTPVIDIAGLPRQAREIAQAFLRKVGDQIPGGSLLTHMTAGVALPQNGPPLGRSKCGVNRARSPLDSPVGGPQESEAIHTGLRCRSNPVGYRGQS